MTPSNVLEQLQWTRVGHNGFNRQIVLAPNSMATTTGTRATSSNSLPADVIVLDGDGEDVIVAVPIPLDYDQESDLLDVSLVVRLESGTSLTVQATAVTAGAVIGAAKTDLADVAGFTPATATLVNAAFDIGYVQANLSGLNFRAGSFVFVNFAAASVTGVGVGHVVAGLITYRSTLVAFAEDNRGNADDDTSTNHLNS